MRSGVIIIPHWRGAPDLLACLASLAAADLAGADVLLVDNGSDDGSVAAAQASFAWIATLRLPENVGFAAAVNAGLRWASDHGAAWALPLNNDTVVAPDFVAPLLACTAAHRRAGLIGPKILYHSDPTRIWQLADVEHRWWPVPQPLGRDARDGPQWTRERRVDYVPFCAVWMRRELIEDVGLLDQRYRLYYEDADYCRRSRAAGWEVWSAPASQIWHKVSRSARLVAPQSRYWHTQTRVMFYRQHPHGPHPALTAAYLATSLGLSLARDLARARPDLFIATLRGVWDGLRAPVGPRR
ncbi:MAG: glycosyltransferase family 2 protein [Ardenticatenaceae bacterium]|nr:glycosyltransferase family 2 protein [Ardenticatenaceae bacterium]